MKNSLKLISVSLLTAATLAPTAQAEVTANVALTTDYVWRGLSQNQEDPAIQGGFYYAHESGFYAGVWAANVSFGDASTESDLYAGWSKVFESGLGVDAGIIEYIYHGSDLAGDNDFTEYYLGLSYVGFNVIYSAGDEFSDHYEIGYSYDFEKVSVSATYGNYDTYSYYNAGVSTEVGGIGLALDYWDTDSDAKLALGDVADSRVVFTISKEF
jgi:uncharacterized protein (TIGR02001 family)